MIRHMILWQLSPSVTNKLAVTGQIKARFLEMAQQIDGMLRVDIDADLGFGTHDIGLYCEFASWTALKNYQTHPLHLAFRAETKQLLINRACVDLEVPS